MGEELFPQEISWVGCATSKDRGSTSKGHLPEFIGAACSDGRLVVIKFPEVYKTLLPQCLQHEEDVEEVCLHASLRHAAACCVRVCWVVVCVCLLRLALFGLRSGRHRV